MFYFRKVFAQNGDITLVPMDNQNDGKVSYDEGWPEGYELDPTIDPDEAQNLSRTNFNGLFYSITSVLQHLQQYGVNPYITATDNGGEAFAYPLGGACSYVDPSTGEYGIYYSLRSNNTDVPSENGITTKFWQRIFAKDWDVLKSNRVTNAPLYFIGEPTYAFEDNIVTFTIPHGSKFLFANGYNSDYTLNSDIVYIQNDATVTLDTTGFYNKGYYLFVTSDEEAIVLSVDEYSNYQTEENVIVDKGSLSTIDTYYYNRAENKWKKRIANTSTFIDLDYSLCLVAVMSIKEAAMISFETSNTLQLVSYKEFENTLSKKQNTLIAGSHISLNPATLDTTVISANVPSNVTPFAVNSCNLDSNGDTDLFVTDSRTEEEVAVKLIAPYGTNGNASYNYYKEGLQVLATNGQSPFAENTYLSCYRTTYSTGTSTVYDHSLAFLDIDFSFNTPVRIHDRTALSFSLSGNFQSSAGSSLGYYPFRLTGTAAITFADGTIYNVNIIYLQTSSSFNYPNYLKEFPQIYNDKTIVSLNLHFEITGINSYINIGNIQIIDYQQVTSYTGQTLGFKAGSNYLELLNNSANATPLMTLDNGVIDSTYPELASLWIQEGTMLNFQEWWENFDSTFTFNTATATTNNAKLFIRYNDLDSDNMLSDFSVLLTYADNTTHYLVEHMTLPRTQDLLLDVPDNKSIKKITVSTRYMSFLGKSSMGMIQLYNNVSDQLTFTQYPALYATSADGSKNFMLNNIAPINLTQSGYIMVNEMGAYILPATNVIRRQRTEPTIEDDPALTNGDIWLDLGSEPLCAYTRHNDQWEICYDVPVGFVEVTIDSAGVTIDSLEQYPINQNGYNLNAFTETIASLSGRDGRDGAPGKDGKNGADGAQGPAGVGVPSGGLQGTVLAKLSNLSYDTGWVPMASTALFNGGQAGMTLIKNSSQDLDFDWGFLSGLPSGGNSGDALVKDSSTDYDVSWQPIHGVPAGGTSGQALVKLSDSDFIYAWQDTGGGDAMLVGTKTNFKLNQCFYASTNGYRDIMFEQFFDTNGINASVDDGAVVISTYWDNQTLMVNNISNSNITFQLTEVAIGFQTTNIVLNADYSGTVAFSISTDSGTTWSAITPEEPIQLGTTTLILKIQLSSLATVSSIAIAMK